MERMIEQPEKEIYNNGLKAAYFYSVNIPHIVKLGKSDFSKAQTALEEHTHPDCFEVCYHYNGQQNYVVEDEVFMTKSGDSFITFPNERHGSGGSPEERSGLFHIIFHFLPDTKNFLGLNDTDTEYIKNSIFSVNKRVFPGSPKIKTILNDILDIYFCQTNMKEARIFALLVEFFYILTTDIDVANRDVENVPGDIASVTAWLDQNYLNKINTNDLADRVFLSPSQFKRKFKKYIGFSPYDYIIRKKIDYAKKMLKTDIRITDIAADLEFSSSQHFATVFKKYTDQTPSDFRKKIDEGTE